MGYVGASRHPGIVSLVGRDSRWWPCFPLVRLEQPRLGQCGFYLSTVIPSLNNERISFPPTIPSEGFCFQRSSGPGRVSHSASHSVVSRSSRTNGFSSSRVGLRELLMPSLGFP